MNLKQFFAIIFFASNAFNVNPIYSKAIDTKKIEHLARYKGRNLDCHYFYKAANPIQNFKTKIAKSEALVEAIYHTDIIIENALKDLMLLEKKSLINSEDIKALLKGENFTNVMNAIELVVLALQSLIVKENLVNDKGELTPMGSTMLKLIKSIVGTSLKREELEKQSHFLEILDTLAGGKYALEKALENMRKSWLDPDYAIKCVMEIRVFIADVCFDVPAIRNHKEKAKYRSATKCFDAYFEKLKKSGGK